MWNKLLCSPLLFLYLFAGTIVAVAAGFAIQNEYLLPAFQIAVAYPVLYSLLAQKKRIRAIWAMLFWALCVAIVMITSSVHFYDRAGNSIIHGRAYVREMFYWIKTGIGAESNPWQFVPQHLLHFVVFAILSVLTASILSLFMGAILMNYMSFYVASVIRASSNELLACLMGWHVWAILRVASFVLLGVILAEPTICRIKKMDYEYASIRKYYWLALHGLVLDVILKTLLAPWWSEMLRRIVHT
jgi:hypothetical protein